MNTQANTKLQDSEIDALLDGTLDDLPDLPEFQPYVPGAHHVRLNWELKEVNKHKTAELKLTLIETKENADPETPVMNPGTETGILFMLDNEFGLGKFKKVMTALSEHFGKKSNRQLMEDSNNGEALIITKLRENKKNPGNFYTDIVELQMV